MNQVQQGNFSQSAPGIEPHPKAHGRQGQVDENDLAPGLHFALPEGITVVRATSPQGGAKGVRTPVHLCPPPWRTSGQKGGVALSTSAPLVRRAVTPGEGGTREAQPRNAVPQRSRGIRVVPRLMRRFVNAQNHNGWGLRPLRERRCGCQNHVHLKCPPPPLKGGHSFAGICVTPRGGNRRSFHRHWVSLFLAPIHPRVCGEQDRDQYSRMDEDGPASGTGRLRRPTIPGR